MRIVTELFKSMSFSGMYHFFRSMSLLRFSGFIFGICLFCFAGWLAKLCWQENRRIKKRAVFLRNLVQGLPEQCRIWKKGEKGDLVLLREINGREERLTVKLEELAHLWQNKSKKTKAKQPKKTTKAEEARFKTKRVQEFYNSISKMNPKHLKVCKNLLDFLEENGNCPSVVPWDIPDAATNYDNKTHKQLEQVSLLDHSLNVAKRVIEDLTKEKKPFLIPDAVVAALGHDLGKIPSKLFLVHQLEDHTVPSAEVANNIAGFSSLAKSEEILVAIKNHHHDSENFLDQILIQANEEAREMEIEQADTAPEPQVSLPTKSMTDAGRHEAKKQASGIDIGGWFDIEAFLQEIKGTINVLSNGKFQAFSMPKGVVYVQVEMISDLLMEQAGKANASEIVMRDKSNNSEMKSVLLAAVQLFRSKGLIAVDELKEGHFMTFFDLHYREEILEQNYTPFRAEAFLAPGETIEELEQIKTGLLLDITAVEMRSGK